MHYVKRLKMDRLAIKIPREVWGIVTVLAATVAAIGVLVAMRH